MNTGLFVDLNNVNANKIHDHFCLQEGGDPNIEGRDGSVPLMVCLVPLINKDPLHHFSHLMKVSLCLFQFLQSKTALDFRFATLTVSASYASLVQIPPAVPNRI